MIEDEARRGDEAAIALDNPAIKEALQAIRDELISQWAETPARDTEAREWLWRHFQVLSKFESILRGYISTGKMAKIEMERKSLAQRMRDKFAA